MIPDCPKGHGPMTLREHPDNLAAWCGTWYDCKHSDLGYSFCSSHLIPSPELLTQHAEMGAAR